MLMLSLLFPGCSADQPLNPSFPLRYKEARSDMTRMRAEPLPLARPVVVAAGMGDPGMIVNRLGRRLRELTGDRTRVIVVDFFGDDTFDECRDRLIRTVDRAFPSNVSGKTTEVDVVGFSMGGIVARYAAIERDQGRRSLNVNRLFTIASPHRGAVLADLPTIDDRKIDLRAGSDFLARVDSAWVDGQYQVIPYARLGDEIVGTDLTAPEGSTAWWVANVPGELAHMQACDDPRIIADIARRLRGELPFTTEPAASLPRGY